MSIPIGIGSLATGLVQGMRLKKEDDRQAEQDAMRKQEFNLQQESRQFDLNNARKVGERQDAEYTRTQGIQQKQDAFKKNFDAAYTAFRSGNEAGAIVGVEATLNDPTLGLPHKAVVDRDANGNPVKGPKGYTLRYMDPATGKEVSRVEGDADTILGGAYVAHDAIGEYGKQQDEKKAADAKAIERAFDLEKLDVAAKYDRQRDAQKHSYTLEEDENKARITAKYGDGKPYDASKLTGAAKVFSAMGRGEEVFPAILASQLGTRYEALIAEALQNPDPASRVMAARQARDVLRDVVTRGLGSDADVAGIEESIADVSRRTLSAYGLTEDDVAKALVMPKPAASPAASIAASGAAAQRPPVNPSLIAPAKPTIGKNPAFTQDQINKSNSILGGGF